MVFTDQQSLPDEPVELGDTQPIDYQNEYYLQ